MPSLTVRKLSTGTLFKLIAIGLTTGLLALFTLFGLMGALGMDVLKWNHEPVTGIKALFAAPLMAVCMALILTALLGSIASFGLWLFSLFKPLVIAYTPTDPNP